VRASNLNGSSLGEESLSKGVKLLELDCGRLSRSLLLDCHFPELIPLIMHLRYQDSATGNDSSVESGNKGGDVFLSGAAVILDLVDGAIKGVDSLLRLLLPLGNRDGVAGNLVLEGAGDLAQGAKGVARVLLHSAHRTQGIVAGLAVRVDFHANVLLAAGNPLHGGISGQGILKGDLLMGRGDLGFLVALGASRAKVLCALNTTHGRVSFLTYVALDYPVDVSFVGLGGFDQAVNEGVAGEECNPAETGEDEGSTALTATEVRRLGLETTKAEGVQAGKGAGVIEGLVAHRAPGQLVD